MIGATVSLAYFYSLGLSAFCLPRIFTIFMFGGNTYELSVPRLEKEGDDDDAEDKDAGHISLHHCYHYWKSVYVYKHNVLDNVQNIPLITYLYLPVP